MGAYLVVETTTPKDVFTVDPMFVTVTDSSASSNRSRSVTLTDHPFKASLVMVKRDADSGQDVIQAGIRLSDLGLPERTVCPPVPVWTRTES